jgi:hypothetical protein
MKKTIKLLQKLGVVRRKAEDSETELSPFDKRLKKVNRARVVNQAGLGAPVFKSRSSETEA